MTDFRKADISKQESYDLLRDWIKLVARHTNPDQDISELLGWLWKLKPATPDPATGLKGCLFCKAMDDYKALQIDPPFAYKYTVAIVSRLYKDGKPRARATSTYYGNGKYVLNYCPMCGRKLEGRQ